MKYNAYLIVSLVAAASMVVIFQNCGEASLSSKNMTVLESPFEESFDIFSSGHVREPLTPEVDSDQSLTVSAGESCRIGGITIGSGASRRMYRKSSVPIDWGGDCEPYSAVRSCLNGNLSGPVQHSATGEYFNKASCLSEVETVRPVINGSLRNKNFRLDYHDEFLDDSGLWRKDNAPMWLGGYRLPNRIDYRDGFIAILNRIGTRPVSPAVPTYNTKLSTTIYPSQNESAHMISKDDFLYGYFEIRAKLTRGPSIDNAFWLMHDRGQEIDIFEAWYINDSSFKVSSNLHPRRPGTNEYAISPAPRLTSHIMVSQPLWKDYHTYGLYWTRDRIVWLMDGNVIREFTDPAIMAHFRMPLRIRLSTAFSAYFKNQGGGPPNSLSSNSEMAISYVRHFRE